MQHSIVWVNPDPQVKYKPGGCWRGATVEIWYNMMVVQVLIVHTTSLLLWCLSVECSSAMCAATCKVLIVYVWNGIVMRLVQKVMPTLWRLQEPENFLFSVFLCGPSMNKHSNWVESTGTDFRTEVCLTFDTYTIKLRMKHFHEAKLFVSSELASKRTSYRQQTHITISGWNNQE